LAGPPQKISGEVTATVTDELNSATVSIKLDMTIKRDRKGCPKVSGVSTLGDLKLGSAVEKDTDHCEPSEADNSSED
jgi:hypothetical protein